MRYLLSPVPGLRLWRRIAAAAALLAAVAAHAQPVVSIGIGLVKPPYVMAPGAALPGLEYEIAEKSLAAGGYRMQAQQLPPARALALLRARQLDGMLTVSEGIGGGDHFSETYLDYQNVAVTLEARGIRLQKIEELRPHSIAAFQNAHLILGEEFKLLAEGHPNYREYPQQVTQNLLLYSGRVDVAVGDRLIFHYLTRQLEAPIVGRQRVSIHRIFPPSPRKGVFRDAAVRDAFNTGLATIRRNGTYAAIMKKYQEYLEPQP